MANEILVVANPRPVAMYRAPPYVMLLRIECDEICVPKTSNIGERETKCFPSRITARTTPRSVSSCKKSGRKAIPRTSALSSRGKWRGRTDEENQENRNDRSLNPIVDRDEIVASSLSTDKLSIGGVSTNGELLVESTEENESKHEKLDGENDEDVVDVEPRMTVIEGEESIDGKLSTEVVVFSREHLFSHSGPDLGLEIEDSTESEISTFSTLSRTRCQ